MTGEPVRIHVGSAHLFKDKSRQLIKCGERNIVVCLYNNQFYAIDNACYHHGGPLLEGDIEDMGGHPCIVCPWHQYRITLDTGEGLYWALQMTPSGTIDRNGKQVVRSKGRKQRIHTVTVEHGEVYVTLNTSGPALDSDAYAEMALANKDRPMTKPISNDGIRSKTFHSSLRSGQVLGMLGLSGSQLLPCGFTQGKVVYCARAEHVCDGTKEFFFSSCRGVLDLSPQPGQFVDLELPIRGPSGRFLRRRWTVVETDKEGCLFTLIIKEAKGSRGGSTWMLKNGLQQRFPLLLVGGRFTLSHNIRRLLELEGRVVVLSAGIGLTAPYALLKRLFDGSQSPVSTDEGNIAMIQVVHLHVDGKESLLPRCDDLVRWCSHQGDRFMYRFHCYLTKQDPSAMSNHLLRPHTTCGRRPTLWDVEEFMGEFVRTSPPLAFVSGPTEFVTMGKNALLSLGVLESDVVTDDPDNLGP